MQHTLETAEIGGAEKKRVEAVVKRLATKGSRGESVAEVAHDARNMVTALGLYCDLLEEPGVLATPFTHYGSELRLVAAASRRLVEKLVALDETRQSNFHAARQSGLKANLNTVRNAMLAAGAPAGTGSRTIDPDSGSKPSVATASNTLPVPSRPENARRETARRWDLMPAAPIESLAAELLASHNLLAALAGPAIVLTVDVEGGARPVRLTGEDLTRVLVNLVKNSAEAMPAGGRIQIELHEQPAAAGAAEALALTIADNGPGIPEGARDQIFASGYTTRGNGAEAGRGWPVIHRGLGLSITRSIVEAAGGRVLAANRAQGGARFEIELPVR
jgi:signal transduction histidine kinase